MRVKPFIDMSATRALLAKEHLPKSDYQGPSEGNVHLEEGDRAGEEVGGSVH